MLSDKASEIDGVHISSRRVDERLRSDTCLDVARRYQGPSMILPPWLAPFLNSCQDVRQVNPKCPTCGAAQESSKHHPSHTTRMHASTTGTYFPNPCIFLTHKNKGDSVEARVVAVGIRGGSWQIGLVGSQKSPCLSRCAPRRQRVWGGSWQNGYTLLKVVSSRRPSRGRGDAQLSIGERWVARPGVVVTEVIDKRLGWTMQEASVIHRQPGPFQRPARVHAEPDYPDTVRIRRRVLE